VIGEEEHDRLVGQSGGLELLQPASGVGIGLADAIVVLGPILAYLRRVRMIGRHAHPIRIVNLFVRAPANLAFVALVGIEHREERLALVAVLPMGLPARFVPDLTRLSQVVVFLDAVRAVVAGTA